MSGPRDGRTATLLRDGRVLVVGGGNTSRRFGEAELYDPGTGRWTPTGAMDTERSGHTATLLGNGRVLVAGGGRSEPDGRVTPLNTAEIYDPAGGRWIATAAMDSGRLRHTAAPLPDGDVLVVGGFDGGGKLPYAERYDPVAKRWTRTPALTTARQDPFAAALLPDGRILVVGGLAQTPGGIAPTASAETYDPVANRWQPAAALTVAREDSAVVALPGGGALVIGGASGQGKLATAERYDPSANRWTPAGAMSTARQSFSATTLQDGRVLVAGASSSAATAARRSPARRFTPATRPHRRQATPHRAHPQHRPGKRVGRPGP